MTTDRVTPLLRGALVPTLAVAAAAVAGAGIIAGRRGALGALAGAAVVLVFSCAGILALRAVRDLDPTVTLIVGVGSYFLRVLVFGGLLAIVGSLDGVDQAISRNALALTVIACVSAWLAGELRTFTRLRVPVYDLDSPPAGDASHRGAS